MTEREKMLIEKSIDGDVTCFEDLIREHQVYAYNIAYKMMGNAQDAEDIAQEAFVKVYRNIGKFNMKSSFSTWLYRIVVNTCKDELKRRKESTISLDQERETESGSVKIEIGDERMNPSGVLDRKGTREMVHEAISKLPANNRSVLILRDLQGFSYEEISEIEGVPVGTIKSRINRGRVLLKKILTEDMELSLENLV